MAWGGALAYTCQLYFDFSGYSDMAIGAARCFGIRFPMNFDSPYKSTSIVEFWRRWHITLSRFLRDYLYFAPRRQPARPGPALSEPAHNDAAGRAVARGKLDVYRLGSAARDLSDDQSRLAGRGRAIAGIDGFRNSRSGAAFGLILTFLAVVVAWVFFRAPQFLGRVQSSRRNGGLAWRRDTVGPGIRPQHRSAAFSIVLGVRFADTSGTALLMTYGWVMALLAIAFLFPNSQQILARFESGVGSLGPPGGRWCPRSGAVARSWWEWRPSALWAFAIGCAAFIAMISITRVSEFLYWQF